MCVRCLSGAVADSCCVQVWWTFIQTLANDLGVAPDNGIVAAPYDWRCYAARCPVDCSQLGGRLSPVMLQERDNYFTKLRHMIEEQVAALY